MSDKKQDIINFTVNEIKNMLTAIKSGQQPIMSPELRALRRELNKISKESDISEEKLDNWANSVSKNIKGEGNDL